MSLCGAFLSRSLELRVRETGSTKKNAGEVPSNASPISDRFIRSDVDGRCRWVAVLHQKRGKVGAACHDISGIFNFLPQRGAGGCEVDGASRENWYRLHCSRRCVCG